MCGVLKNRSLFLKYILLKSNQILLTKKVESNETTISMKNLAPATYFLKVQKTDEGASIQDIKTFKIVKN